MLKKLPEPKKPKCSNNKIFKDGKCISECKKNEVLKNGKCLNTENLCKKDFVYYEAEKKCIKKHDIQQKKCKKGYTMKNGKCIKIETKKCKKGYVLNKKTKKCEKKN